MLWRRGARGGGNVFFKNPPGFSACRSEQAAVVLAVARFRAQRRGRGAQRLSRLGYQKEDPAACR